MINNSFYKSLAESFFLTYFLSSRYNLLYRQPLLEVGINRVEDFQIVTL